MLVFNIEAQANKHFFIFEYKQKLLEKLSKLNGIVGLVHAKTYLSAA